MSHESVIIAKYMVYIGMAFAVGAFAGVLLYVMKDVFDRYLDVYGKQRDVEAMRRQIESLKNDIESQQRHNAHLLEKLSIIRETITVNRPDLSQLSILKSFNRDDIDIDWESGIQSLKLSKIIIDGADITKRDSFTDVLIMTLTSSVAESQRLVEAEVLQNLSLDKRKQLLTVIESSSSYINTLDPTATPPPINNSVYSIFKIYSHTYSVTYTTLIRNLSRYIYGDNNAGLTVVLPELFVKSCVFAVYYRLIDRLHDGK